MAILHLISIHIFLGLTTALELLESRAVVVGQTGVAGNSSLSNSSQNDILKFRTIEDILEENQKLHAIIRGIVEDVEDLKKRMNNTEEQMAATNIRVDTALCKSRST